MAEDHRSDEEPGIRHSGGPQPGVPRWVKAVAILVAALVALLILARLTGIGGNHGPGRHVGGSSPAPAAADSPTDGERGW